MFAKGYILTKDKEMEDLRTLRLQAKKTVAEVAKVLNVEYRAYYRYEEGTRRISLEQVLLLAVLFDCSCEEIIHAALVSIRK
jgi:transcriptional regulator with XRE-family HTH domain